MVGVETAEAKQKEMEGARASRNWGDSGGDDMRIQCGGWWLRWRVGWMGGRLKRKPRVPLILQRLQPGVEWLQGANEGVYGAHEVVVDGTVFCNLCTRVTWAGMSGGPLGGWGWRRMTSFSFSSLRMGEEHRQRLQDFPLLNHNGGGGVGGGDCQVSEASSWSCTYWSPGDVVMLWALSWDIGSNAGFGVWRGPLTHRA